MKNLLQQAIRFVGLSGIGWILDFVVYTVLSFITENPFLSNVFSSCVGASFVFLFSTRFVFENNSKIPLKVKYFIYIIYQMILIFLSSRLLALINAYIVTYFTCEWIIGFSAVISKILVTPITMILNFFVMKGVVERI